MSEPELFGYPLHMLFLYFILYSFLGWAMETVFCSIRAKKLVPRGFLKGPICPIYGIGVLMMICLFQPFVKWPILFFLISIVVMSAWEYFVSWLLEVTTHVKYWDYSKHRFNLHGRICLQISLTWGVLSFVVVYIIHPLVKDVVIEIPAGIRYDISIVLAVILLIDVITTVRKLALVRKFMTDLKEAREKLDKAHEEYEAKREDGHKEKEEKVAKKRVEAEARAMDLGEDEIARLEAEYDALLERGEQTSNRFLKRYNGISSKHTPQGMEDLRAFHEEKEEERRQKKAGKKSK